MMRGALLACLTLLVAGPALADYHSMDTTLAGKTVVLTGRDLTIRQLLEVARHGAHVQLNQAALQREADNYGLLLEAQAEGVPVYLLNRGGGLGRAVTTLDGDPMSPQNKVKLAQRELARFQQGALMGAGPEVADEQIVRATMVIRANTLIFEAPSPQLARMLLDLLNSGITPVMQSQGTVGESDFGLLPNINATMVGRGEAYYHGVRMGAAEALAKAGLAPLEPFGTDSSAFANANAYSTALAALLVDEGRHALEWTDVADAVDLDGMNGSITPLSLPVQRKRPDEWLNFDAARILEMLRGSYLFDADPARILADADSLRASSIRQGAAWRAWGALRDAVLLQMNSSDHNPVVSVGLSPADSWELATPQMQQYYVKGGTYSHGQHGYIVSSANWDPYPMANDIEAFTNALANVGVVVVQRMQRFANPFFTVLKAADVVAPEQLDELAPQGDAYLTMHLWQQLQMLAAPVPAEGIATDSQANGDIESQAALKAARGRQAVDLLEQLLGQDLLTGTYWMDLRRLQDPRRAFGPAPTGAWQALRREIPWQAPPGRRGDASAATIAAAFVHATEVRSRFESGIAEPGCGRVVPVADAARIR
ncbi:MAG: aromatic amino acid ammonia-lyase [Steroidobacterales bacterium]